MKERQRRIDSMERQLLAMYESLYGSAYIAGLQPEQKSEFNAIVSCFKEIIFHIKRSQEERDKKESSRNYAQSPEGVRFNHLIREDIKNAETMLSEASKAIEVKKRDTSENIKRIRMERDQTLKSCLELLRDVQESEQGGTYVPPREMHSLAQLKGNLIGEGFRKSEREQYDAVEERALEQIEGKDKEIDDMLDEVIEVNRVVHHTIKAGQEMMDQQRELINKNLNKADKIDQQVVKGNKDLLDVLVSYRRPSKLCLDVTLILLVLALIGVIINMVKNGV